jgi:hypothetical protein
MGQAAKGETHAANPFAAGNEGTAPKKGPQAAFSNRLDAVARKKR